MPRERVTIGTCPKCGADGLTCSYNHFANDELTIDSWEHKCGDCGFRDTTAFRSDDEPGDLPENPAMLPLLPAPRERACLECLHVHDV